MANNGIVGFEITLDKSLRTSAVVAMRKAKFSARHAKRPAAVRKAAAAPKAKR